MKYSEILSTSWVEFLNSLTHDGCSLRQRQFLCRRLIVNNDQSLLLQRSTHHLNCTYWRQGERKQLLTLVPAEPIFYVMSIRLHPNPFIIQIADSVQTEYCPTFLLSVCPSVCHRRDILHFSHI